MLTRLNRCIDAIYDGIDVLEMEIKTATGIDDSLKRARAFCDGVIPAMDTVRAAVDEAELLVGDDYWPVPTYNEMLFYT
jgi:glutamine synthetase